MFNTNIEISVYFLSQLAADVYSVLDVNKYIRCRDTRDMEDITSLFTPPHITMPCVCYVKYVGC